MTEQPSLKWYEENTRKLGELNHFLQKRSTGKAGEHVIDVAIELIQELESRNKELNREIGSYAGKVGEIAHSIGVDISDLKILVTRMCNAEDESHV